MKENHIIESIKIICEYLNKNKINYVIVGGVSVIAWGRARTTEDIDFIIDHNKLTIEDFVNYLNHKPGMFRMDIIGVYNHDNVLSIKNAVDVEFHDITIKIDSPESLVVHKLLFGSQQDLEDAFAVYTS